MRRLRSCLLKRRHCGLSWRARGIAFLNRSQIRAGRLRGGVPRRVREFRDDVEDARERTLPGTVRIDYVQHAASAMLAYGELLGWFGDDSD